MTKEQMLEQLGIGDADLRDYLKKSSQYVAGLNDAQFAFHSRTQRPSATLERLAAWFGPDVTVDDMRHLFAEAPPWTASWRPIGAQEPRSVAMAFDNGVLPLSKGQRESTSH